MGIDRLVMFLTNSTSTWHELMWVTARGPVLTLGYFGWLADIKEVQSGQPAQRGHPNKETVHVSETNSESGSRMFLTSSRVL